AARGRGADGGGRRRPPARPLAPAAGARGRRGQPQRPAGGAPPAARRGRAARTGARSLVTDDAHDAALAALRALHEQVDREAAQIAERHRGRLLCGRGCASCCSDDLSVTQLEAERIRRAHPALGTPHARGACAMLGAEGECRVYEVRPYVCRTQGLPLRWLAEDADGEIVEHRAICPLNLESPPHPPLAALAEDDCWLLG